MVTGLLLACREPTDPPPAESRTPDTGETATSAHTGFPPDPDDPFLDCSLDPDNALRGTCTVDAEAPGPIRLELRASGEDTRVFTSDDALATRHEIPFWGLPPAVTFTVVARNTSTGDRYDVRLRTRPLPEEIARLEVTVTQTGDSGVDAVVFPPLCPPLYVVAVDRRGRVVFYQDTQPEGFLGGINGFSLTERGTFLVSIGKSRLREFDFSGALVRELVRGEDFEELVHHDVVERDGYTYLPYARLVRAEGEEWITDGVYVFGPDDTLVDALDTAGLFPREERPWMREGYWQSSFPDAIDLSHLNSVAIGDDGDLWVSFRHLFAVARFAGGPGTPAFGTLRELIVGDPASPVAAQATRAVGGGPLAPFAGQHDAHLASDGTLLLLDNGLDRNRNAEASRYLLDATGAQATWVEGWDLGRQCTTQGAVRELGDRHVLTTCTGDALVQEFVPGRAEPVWTASLRCSGQPSSLAEGIPLSLPTR